MKETAFRLNPSSLFFSKNLQKKLKTYLLIFSLFNAQVISLQSILCTVFSKIFKVYVTVVNDLVHCAI